MGGKRAVEYSVSTLAILILCIVNVPGPFASPAQATTQTPQAGPLRLEDGTAVKIRLTQTISSATAQTNDRVDFEVLDEVKVGNLLVIPKGSIAWGTVTEAEPKKRMGRGGKLNVNIDAVRLGDGEKAALRGVKDVKGGGHKGAMTGAMVATGLVMWPAAPLFLLMHGKDITIPQGTELTVYVNGDFPLDAAKFGGAPPVAPPAAPPVETPAAASAPTIVLVDPSLTSAGETINVTTPTLNIRGVVTDASGIPAVTINGTPVGMLPKGPQAAEFSSSGIKLEAGDNAFEIVATNAAKGEARITFVAHFAPAGEHRSQPIPRSSSKALGKGEIISLLKGGVPSTRVAGLVGERGISFKPTENDLQEIRAAGGQDDLIGSLTKAKVTP